MRGWAERLNKSDFSDINRQITKIHAENYTAKLHGCRESCHGHAMHNKW
jgi:hypothetical protein